MFRSSEFTKEVYKTGEVARILGVVPMTVINYDKQGLLRMSRNPAGRRFIRREDLLGYLRGKGLLEDDMVGRRDVIYTRVGFGQNESSDRQILEVVRGVGGMNDPVVLSDVGDGDDDSRPELRRLVGMVLSGQVRNVYVSQKGVLAGAGYFYLETLFGLKGVKVVSVRG